jgi:hypothetical protein
MVGCSARFSRSFHFFIGVDGFRCSGRKSFSGAFDFVRHPRGLRYATSLAEIPQLGCVFRLQSHGDGLAWDFAGFASCAFSCASPSRFLFHTLAFRGRPIFGLFRSAMASAM